MSKTSSKTAKNPYSAKTYEHPVIDMSFCMSIFRKNAPDLAGIKLPFDAEGNRVK